MKWNSLILVVLSLTLFAGEDALLDPNKAVATAPASFRVQFNTSKGDFTVKVTREWAPLGADRFYNLVQAGFFKDIAFYRVVDGFMVQFGFSSDPAVNKAWKNSTIKDDLVKQSNTPGRISFANRGPHTRTTQLFINTINNSNLDAMGFAPFGEVEAEGLAIVKALYSGYGEGYPRGTGPRQDQIESKGAAYLKENYPQLDYIKSVVLLNDTQE